MNSQSIQAVVFDLGGVVFREGKSIAAERLTHEKMYDKKVVLDVLKSPKSLELRAGFISDNEFWQWAQNQLPDGYNAQLIKGYWYDAYILDEDIFSLLKRLHRTYKLFILSGNIKSRVEYLDQKYHFRKYFDLEIYSYECGFNKPQKEFVEALLKKTDIPPQAMVYIDDTEEAAQAARHHGMQAVIYQTGKIEKLKNELMMFGIKI